MSVDALRWAFNVPVGHPTRKLILIALADYADEDNHCWPSQKKLASRAECSVDTIQRHLAALEVDGLIERQKGTGRVGGGRACDSYRLVLSGDESRNLRPMVEGDESRNLRPIRKPQTEGGNGRKQGGARAAPVRLSNRESPTESPSVESISHSSASLQNDSGALRAEVEASQSQDKTAGPTCRDITDYSYIGRTIRLIDKDYQAWLARFPAIKNLDAELDRADAYYTKHPPKNGQWFFAVSAWLKKINDKTLAKIQQEAPIGAVVMPNGQVFSRW